MRRFALPVNRGLSDGKPVKIGDDYKGLADFVRHPLPLVKAAQIIAAMPFKRKVILLLQRADDYDGAWQIEASEHFAVITGQ